MYVKNNKYPHQPSFSTKNPKANLLIWCHLIYIYIFYIVKKVTDINILQINLMCKGRLGGGDQWRGELANIDLFAMSIMQNGYQR